MGEKSKSSNTPESSWDHPVFMAFVIIMLILGATFLFVSAGYIDDSRGLIDTTNERPLDKAFLKRHANVILGLVLATGIGLVVAFITTTILAAQKRHPKEIKELKRKIEDVLTPRDSEPEEPEKSEEANVGYESESDSEPEESIPVPTTIRAQSPRPVPTRPMVSRLSTPARRTVPSVNLA